MTASKEYQALLQKKHGEKQWGSSRGVPDMAKRTVERYDVSSIVDFGCGKGLVTESLRKNFPTLDITGYDPGRPETKLPDEVDMVFSKDVLEHVEPHMLESTLQDLYRRTKTVQYHLIACHRAVNYMADGRNAHLIVETPDWWQRLFRSMGFKIVEEDVLGAVKTIRGREPFAITKYEIVIDCR